MFKNLIFNNLTQGLSFGSRWLLNIVLAKKMEIEEYAIFSFLYSISNFLSSIISFGSELYILREKNNSQKIMVDSILISIFSFLCCLFIWFLINISDIPLDNKELIVLSIVFSLTLSINYILNSYFKSVNQFYNGFKNIVFLFGLTILSIAGIIFFHITDLLDIFALLIFINSLSIIYILLKNNLYFSLNVFNLKLEFYKKRIYYGLHALQSAIYSQVGLLVLFYLLTKNEYTIYRIFFLIIMPLSLFNSSISQVLLVKFKSFDSYFLLKKFFRKVFIILILLSIIIFTILYKSEKLLFDYFNISENYKIDFYIFLTIPTVQILNSTYSSMLTNLGYQKIRFYATSVSAFLTVVLMFIYVKQYGLVSAIIINVIAFSLLFMINFISTEYIIRKKNVN